MEVSIIRFSRPLFERNDYNDEHGHYEVIYGFIITPAMRYDIDKLNDYVGYLAGMSCWANGDDFFMIEYDEYGLPNWRDSNGVFHYKQDEWMESIERKCVQKLNLTYDTINLEMRDEDIYKYANDDLLIVDEMFYYDLERYMKAHTPQGFPKYSPLF